jgi:predicted NACHT family NTPase
MLKDPKHQATRELARTPLLATFLCLVYDDRQKLPTNRAELYGDALRILLERWAASKGCNRASATSFRGFPRVFARDPARVGHLGKRIA